MHSQRQKYHFKNASKDILDQRFNTSLQKITISQAEGKSFLRLQIPEFSFLSLIYDDESHTVEFMHHRQSKSYFEFLGTKICFRYKIFNNFRKNDFIALNYGHNYIHGFNLFSAQYDWEGVIAARTNVGVKFKRNRPIDNYLQVTEWELQTEMVFKDVLKMKGFTAGQIVIRSRIPSFRGILPPRFEDTLNLRHSDSVIFKFIRSQNPFAWETHFGADFSNSSYFCKMLAQYKYQKKLSPHLRLKCFFQAGQLFGKNLFKADMFYQKSRTSQLVPTNNFINPKFVLQFNKFSFIKAFGFGLYFESWMSGRIRNYNLQYKNSGQIGFLLNFENENKKIQFHIALLKFGAKKQKGIYSGITVNL